MEKETRKQEHTKKREHFRKSFKEWKIIKKKIEIRHAAVCVGRRENYELSRVDPINRQK